MQKPLERLRKKITVENLWIYILCMLKDRSMYAYEIQNEVDKRFNFRPGRITVYVVLYKLENSGYVRTEWKEKGRQRKYYLITESGRILLEEGISTLEKVMEEIKR